MHLNIIFPYKPKLSKYAFCSAFPSEHLCAFDHLNHPAVHVRETLRNDLSFLRSLLKLSLRFNPYLYPSGKHRRNAEAKCIKKTLKDVLFTG